jgi:Zn-dependent protease
MTSKFDSGEIRSIMIAWVVLSFGVTFNNIVDLFNGIPGSLEVIVAGFIVTATGFIIHEMGHKYVAIRRGYSAHFRVWIWGIALTIISVIISGGGLVFGAPGAVYITPASTEYNFGRSNSRTIDPDEDNMIISAMGPGINLAFALFFLALFSFSSLNSFSEVVGTLGFGLNVGLGSFNMIPIPPLDGSKIFRKSIVVGLAIALPLWAMFAFFFIL